MADRRLDARRKSNDAICAERIRKGISDVRPSLCGIKPEHNALAWQEDIDTWPCSVHSWRRSARNAETICGNCVSFRSEHERAEDGNN